MLYIRLNWTELKWTGAAFVRAIWPVDRPRETERMRTQTDERVNERSNEQINWICSATVSTTIDRLCMGVWCVSVCMLVRWWTWTWWIILHKYIDATTFQMGDLFARNWFDVFKIIVYWPKNKKELRYTHSLLHISYVNNCAWFERMSTNTHVSHPIHILCTRSATSFAKYEKNRQPTKVYHYFPMQTH